MPFNVSVLVTFQAYSNVEVPAHTYAQYRTHRHTDLSDNGEIESVCMCVSESEHAELN